MKLFKFIAAAALLSPITALASGSLSMTCDCYDSAQMLRGDVTSFIDLSYVQKWQDLGLMNQNEIPFQIEFILEQRAENMCAEGYIDRSSCFYTVD